MNLDPHPPFVSVIVPAYNAHDALSPCLESLERQSYPRHRYEVIVVDNGSFPSLESLVSRFPRVIYEFEARPSSYAARNRGLSRAVGEVLAFTDADCIADEDWLQNGVRRLQQTPRCGLVGGKIELFFQIEGKPSLAELCDQLIFGFEQQRYVEEERFAATANAFAFRAVVEAVGGFDSALKSGGDVDLGNRIATAGYALVYSETCVVRHPARVSVRSILQKARRLQGGHIDQERRKGKPGELWTEILRRLVYFWKLLDSQRIRRKLSNYRAPDGTRLRIPLRRQRQVVMVYRAVRLAQQGEALRLLLGGLSRRC